MGALPFMRDRSRFDEMMELTITNPLAYQNSIQYQSPPWGRDE